MKRALIGPADFAALRRQMQNNPAKLAELVARIEQQFRAALEVEDVTDDAIVTATLDAGEQTDTEQTDTEQTDTERVALRVALRVVRACIGYREAKVKSRHLWLDYLAVAIAAADPLLLVGATFSKGKPQGATSQVTRYILAERRPGETARRLWERLKALGASDGQPIYFDGDEMIDARTSKTISFEAFEKRLIVHKRK
jgi:hypothetical protein